MDNALEGLITFDGRRFEYALRARAREAAPPAIRFCPWCGSLLFRVRVKREEVVPASRPRKKSSTKPKGR